MAITVELTPEIEARLIAQAITAEAYLQAAIENLLNSQPKVYKVGTSLVVESKPISNLENCVEQVREERISNIIADYESSV